MDSSIAASARHVCSGNAGIVVLAKEGNGDTTDFAQRYRQSLYRLYSSEKNLSLLFNYIISSDVEQIFLIEGAS